MPRSPARPARDTEVAPLAPPRATRLAGATLVLLQALVLGVSAALLPLRMGAFSIACGLVSLAGLLTAVTGFIGLRSWPRIWRAHSFAALALLAYLTYVVVFSAAHVAGLYDGLGPGVAAGLLAIAAVPLLLLLPISLWGLAATGGVRRRAAGALALLLALAPVVGGSYANARARGTTLPGPATADWQHLLSATGQAIRGLPIENAPPPVFSPRAIACPRPPEALPDGQASLFATFVERGSRSTQSLCLQGHADAVAAQLADTLRQRAVRTAVTIDVITAHADLRRTPGLAAPFAVRPGLDGVCADARCLMPAQLVALEQFGSYRPLDFVEHLRLGVDLDRLGPLLGAEADSPRRRVATASFVIDPEGRVRALKRLRGAPPALTPETISRATTLAERYIRAAQKPDGRFTYELNPFTGGGDREGFSLARQAATTMVLCDLGDGEHPATQSAVERSLALLAGLATPLAGDGATVVFPVGNNQAQAGNVALTLGAFIKCRKLVARHDALIGQLGRFLLSLQGGNGRFLHVYDVNAARALPGRFTLYADGEIVYALAMLENLAAATPSPTFPEVSALHAAVERAMDYFGRDYWNHPAAELFALEENWHCTAAREALARHQHADYERFCIHYARFKIRAVYGGHEADPQFKGAYGLGNVTVPMTTPTSGFGETAAGALAVMKARGLDATWLAAPLEDALRFLLMAQWTEEDCYACVHPDVLGGFSKSLSDPVVRIDYVQHAWAALGFGAQALGIEAPR